MTTLVMALDDPAAELATVGGKGASLARLARAGLPVPDGFHVTTSAYHEFVEGAGLREPIEAALADVPSDAEGVSARIGALFAAHEPPAATADAIREAYVRLGGDVAVAVRSSATAEDLPDMSFAGQQDTYLNVRGEEELLDAVRRCWASLWTARAIDYRARHGVAAADVALAVVVQRMVDADAAGVLFTADPVTGARERTVVNAAWGLGEAVVGGQVTPDTATVEGDAVDYRVADKQIMTVRTDTGTEERRVPEELRERRVLDDAEVAELAGLGDRIERLYGMPMDVEWVRDERGLSVVQARPITNLGRQPAETEEWNDSLDGDYLWSNGNLGEAIPDVMTPATWSFVKLFMSRAMASVSLPGYRGYGRVGGRFYMNVSMSAALAGNAGISGKRFRALTEPVIGTIPEDMTIPRIPLSRLRVLRLLVPTAIDVVRRVRAVKGQLPGYLASAADRCDEMRARVDATGTPAALAELWSAEVEPYAAEAADILGAAGRQGGAELLRAPMRLRKLVGGADAAALLSAQGADTQLASLGPAVGMAQLARGEIDRETFARRYGHRGVHEFEVSMPRPAEDPDWLDRQLASVREARDTAEELLERQEAARSAAWRRLRERHPRQVAKVRRLVERWAAVARAREATRSEVIRSFWALRHWMLRAGELTGRGDDLFFLYLEEVLQVLRGDDAPLALVERRRATYEKYCALPPYPTLIRGRFDPVRWAADPDRRTDCFDEQDQVRPTSDTVTGHPGAAGVVEGVARLVERVEDADRLGAGEVLVTTVTNIGWTPVFPRAAAVVTDVGAPLSHAAIVARELGIPAVVGCGNAMMRLHDGDRVRVDGSAGTVDVISERVGAPSR